MFRRTKVPLADWDFRDCTVGGTGFASERGFFFSDHFLEIVAISSMRLEIILLLAEDGWFVVDDSREFASYNMPHGGASFLRGMRGKERDRLTRKALKQMAAEHEKHGRIRLDILPPMPGLMRERGELLEPPA